MGDRVSGQRSDRGRQGARPILLISIVLFAHLAALQGQWLKLLANESETRLDWHDLRDSLLGEVSGVVFRGGAGASDRLRDESLPRAVWRLLARLSEDPRQALQELCAPRQTITELEG